MYLFLQVMVFLWFWLFFLLILSTGLFEHKPELISDLQLYRQVFLSILACFSSHRVLLSGDFESQALTYYPPSKHDHDLIFQFSVKIQQNSVLGTTSCPLLWERGLKTFGRTKPSESFQKKQTKKLNSEINNSQLGEIFPGAVKG